MTSLRIGRTSKVCKRTRQRLTNEAAKRPVATLKEPQEHVTSTDYTARVTH